MITHSEAEPECHFSCDDKNKCTENEWKPNYGCFLFLFLITHRCVCILLLDVPLLLPFASLAVQKVAESVIFNWIASKCLANNSIHLHCNFKIDSLERMKLIVHPFHLVASPFLLLNRMPSLVEKVIKKCFRCVEWFEQFGMSIGNWAVRKMPTYGCTQARKCCHFHRKINASATVCDGTWVIYPNGDSDYAFCAEKGLRYLRFCCFHTNHRPDLAHFLRSHHLFHCSNPCQHVCIDRSFANVCRSNCFSNWLKNAKRFAAMDWLSALFP